MRNHYNVIANTPGFFCGIRQVPPLMCVLLILFMQSLHAEDTWELNGSIGVSTDYIYRGLAYSVRPTPRANLYIGHQSGLFLNTWFSRDDIAGVMSNTERRDSEFEYNLGYSWQFHEQWSLTLNHAWVEYNRVHQPADHDYREIRLSLDYQDQFTLFAAHTDSIWGTNSSLTTASIAGRRALPFGILAEAEIGWLDFDFEPDTDFPFLRVSTGKALTKNISAAVEFHYSDTKANRIFNSQRVGGNWVGVLTYHF